MPFLSIIKQYIRKEESLGYDTPSFFVVYFRIPTRNEIQYA